MTKLDYKAICYFLFGAIVGCGISHLLATAFPKML